MIGVTMIMFIILAVLALVVVKALAESPWGTFTVAMTIPIALFMGIYLRYLLDDVRVVKGVGVFQKGSVAFVPRPLAVWLITSGDFEPVTTGPLARVFVVRIGQDKLAPADAEPPTRVEPESPADFEQELEEEELRLAAAAASADGKPPAP